MPSVLLITDNTTYRGGAPRYLGPYRIAHALEEAGIKTYVLDFFYLFPDFLKFLEEFLDEDFIAVGFSTTFLTPPAHSSNVQKIQKRRERNNNYLNHGIIRSDLNELQAWFRDFKEVLNRKSPKAKVFVGGAKARLFLDPPYSNIPEIDYVTLGAVDLVFPEVIREIIAGKEPSLVQQGSRKIIDTLNTYRQPKACPRHDWKKHWGIQKGEALPIEIGRGCAFNCKFCHYDKKENFRKSLDDLRQEFISNYENHGTQFYHFSDDCFNDNRGKVEEVCNMIKSLPFKIEWVSYARFDVAVKFPETARLMIESGARGLYWGIESFNYEVARRAGKGTPPDKIKEFLKSFYRDYGDICYMTGSFISGLPGETRATWIEEMNWMLENPCLHYVTVGSLGLASYKPELDNKVIDYADYSRNPAKYGFEEITFNPFYWRHSTMDFHEAEELSQLFVEKWRELSKDRTGLVVDIWIYPHLRSLGFSESEVRDFYESQDPSIKEALLKKLYDTRKARMINYVGDMRKEIEARKTSSSQSGLILTGA